MLTSQKFLLISPQGWPGKVSSEGYTIADTFYRPRNAFPLRITLRSRSQDNKVIKRDLGAKIGNTSEISKAGAMRASPMWSWGKSSRLRYSHPPNSFHLKNLVNPTILAKSEEKFLQLPYERYLAISSISKSPL